MDTHHQHTGHELFPGFSIIHANHLEDLRQVAVGWIRSWTSGWMPVTRPCWTKTLAVVREHILARMKESSMSQRFLAGMVNFGTLMPMRAIRYPITR